jgi:hypothetical protein
MKKSAGLGLALFLFALGCGGAKPDTKQATNAKPANPDEPPDAVDSDGGAKPDDTAPKKDPCTGFEMDLGAALMNAACEVPNPKTDDKSLDTKGKLEITVVPSSSTVSPGGHADLTVTLTNKSSSPIALSFTLDPTPRFPTETYDSKQHRIDMPSANPPALPKGMAPREATSHETARITIVPNGTAKMVVPWDAVKMKWAPDKLKGTPPEMGYPRVPAGPLAKGVYTVRVAMPLVLVFEGTEREVSAPKVQITVK